MSTKELTVLGTNVRGYVERVETFEAPSGVSQITMTSDEVIAFFMLFRLLINLEICVLRANL